MPKVGEQIEKGGRRLQPQQQKFLDNYIHKDMTQTGAARAAGYKSPNVRAVQLLKNPVVRERMEEMSQSPNLFGICSDFGTKHGKQGTSEQPSRQKNYASR